MKASKKFAITILAILLAAVSFFSTGCDADTAWDTVNSSKGKIVLAGLFLELTRKFSVGGTVTGLVGTLELQNNGTETLTIMADGSFHFINGLHRRAAYDVTVVSQPAGQDCTVTNETGTIVNSAVTNVTVTCTAITP